MLHRSDAANSREYAEQSSRAMRIAALLGEPRNPTQIEGHMPFRLPNHRTPMKVGGLPRINLFTFHNDDVSSVGSIDRGGGYTTHFARPWSDEYYSGQIGDGYTRHLSGRVNDNNRLQWRPGLFGGITATYRSEFGRGLNTFLTSDTNGYTHHLSRHDDDDDVGDTRNLSRHGDDSGYTRHLTRHGDDELEDSTRFQLHPGPFGGITPRFRNEFGCSQSTLLSGGRGFLTSSVDSDDIETNQRGRTDLAADSHQSDGGRSVLANLRQWRRQRDSRRRAPSGEMQLPQWLQDVEPEQRRHESSVDNDDSLRRGNDDVTDQHTD